MRLLVARTLLVALPFRIVTRRLTVRDANGLASDELLRRVRWAIGAVSRRAPWRCKCLEQGIAAKMMLRARRIPNTLYMGVARREGAAAVEAHAWLRAGTMIVTGGEGHEQFTVVSSYADGAPAGQMR